MKKKVIWISPHLPYDKVNHAGGNIQNFYMKRLIETEKYEMKLISFYKPDELSKFTMNKYIDCRLFCYYDYGIKKILRSMLDFNYLKNPFHKYANKTTLYIKNNILKELRKIRKEKFIPDVIVLQWTQTIFFVKEIKQVFPQAKVIGIEEDVSLLSLKRQVDLQESKIAKKIAKIKYKNIELSEIEALKFCDRVILNNHKDEKLLQEYGFDQKLRVWTPYFNNMNSVERSETINRNIIFYGAMSRPENYLSAIWLLEKVKPLVEDLNIHYLIIGGNPPECLKKYASKDVTITGFVDDIEPYFSNSLCLVAPLILGAGIKIKILEAMSAGIPVLTNTIGIEGIFAKNGKEFFFCETPEEYAESIRNLVSSKFDFKVFENNSKSFIEENFNYNKSAEEFVGWIDEVVK